MLQSQILIDDNCITIGDEPILLTFEEFVHDDEDRSYDIYFPEGDLDNALLVFVLHGYTGTARSIRSYSGFNDVADEENFVVVYPQGLTYDRATHWNAELSLSSVDDIGFLDSLAQYLQTEYNLSVDNTFITGHSNGGFMSYRMACNRSETFNAIASYAGLMSYTTWNTCDPPTEVDILHIHGTNDAVVPNDGSMSMSGGFGGAPDILTMLGFWTDYNGTSTLVETDVSSISHVYTYTSDQSFLKVTYIEITNQDHGWPGDNDIIEDENYLNDTSELIWEFFESVLVNSN